MKNIVINLSEQKPVEEQNVEIVERKGIGHPDTICDGIADKVSRELSKEYMKRFGSVLHHNTDKVQLVAGKSVSWFGGGEVLQPMYVLLAGRAVDHVPDKDNAFIPIHGISMRAAKDHIKSVIPNIDIDDHVEVSSRISHGSSDLVHVFNRESKIPLANDTSLGVGFAPMSLLENLVMKAENVLNSPEMKKRYPAIGEDIKVMGSRVGDGMSLSVALAFVSKYVDDPQHYLTMKEEIAKHIIDMCSDMTEKKVKVLLNTADNHDDPSSFYLTVTGTSAENGDDGAVGRGNRCNGLITPNRPWSAEAVCGKNPVNHIGKIYNILSFDIAQKIAGEFDFVKEAYVKILSQIGKPIDEPLLLSADIVSSDNAKLEANRGAISSLIDGELDSILSLQEGMIKGKYNVY